MDYLLNIDFWVVIRAISYPGRYTRTAEEYESGDFAVCNRYYGLVLSSKTLSFHLLHDAIASERIDIIDHVFTNCVFSICKHHGCVIETFVKERDVSSRICLHIYLHHCSCLTKLSIDSEKLDQLIEFIFRDKDLETAKTFFELFPKKHSISSLLKGIKNRSKFTTNSVPLIAWYYKTFDMAQNIHHSNYIVACMFYAFRTKDVDLLRWIDDTIDSKTKRSCLMYMNPLATYLRLEENFRLCDLDVNVIGEILWRYQNDNRRANVVFVLEMLVEERLDILSILLKMNNSHLVSLVCSSMVRYICDSTEKEIVPYSLLSRLLSTFISSPKVCDWLNDNFTVGPKSRTTIIREKILSNTESNMKQILVEAMIQGRFDVVRFTLENYSAMNERCVIDSVISYMQNKNSVKSANFVKYMYRYSYHKLRKISDPYVSTYTTPSLHHSWYDIGNTSETLSIFRLFLRIGIDIVKLRNVAKKDNLELFIAICGNYVNDDYDDTNKFEKIPLISNSMLEVAGPNVFRWIMKKCSPNHSTDNTHAKKRVLNRWDITKSRVYIWDYVNNPQIKYEDVSGEISALLNVIGKYTDLEVVLEKILEADRKYL